MVFQKEHGMDWLNVLSQGMAWLFTLIGYGLMLLGMVLLLRLAWRLKGAHTTDGMIVGIDQREGHRGLPYDFPQVCFKYQGREYTITGSIGLPAGAYDLGAKVQVFFPPDRPEAADIKAFANTWLVGLCLVLFGWVFGSGASTLIHP